VRVNTRLSGDEVAAVLAEGTKLQLATVNPDGTPHLVTMFYALVDDRIAFWTYRASQKARNLERDPRVTCLVEAGDDYFTLRGVQVGGLATPTDDPAAVADIGARVVARSAGLPREHLDGYVAHTAPKRRGYVVEPVRVASWDHRTLGGA
jgi:PPOX class probable F420-dependent enzyme